MLSQNSQSLKEFAREGEKGRKRSSAQAELVTLGWWEEVEGRLEEVSRSSNCVKVVIRLGHKMVALLIPTDNLIGVLPNPGTNVAILSTDEGFRIKNPRQGTPVKRRG